MRDPVWDKPARVRTDVPEVNLGQHNLEPEVGKTCENYSVTTGREESHRPILRLEGVGATVDRVWLGRVVTRTPSPTVALRVPLAPTQLTERGQRVFTLVIRRGSRQEPRTTGVGRGDGGQAG